MRPGVPSTCSLCGRARPLTFHHLIPRKVHRKRRFASRYDRREMTSRGIWVCRLCHRQIHRFFSEMELADDYNTAEFLRAEPRMRRFLEWARRQK